MAGITELKLVNSKGKPYKRYRITYYDIFGKKCTSPYYKTRASATQDLFKYENVDPKTLNITIEQMCYYYMENARTKHSYTTIKDTEAYMKNHLCQLFNIKYEKMSSIDLERFINGIAETHTPNVANQALKKIKAVANYCLKHGLIKENKFKVVGNIPVESGEHYPLELDEMICVLNTCQTLYPKHFAMIYTGIATGTRLGELSALTIDDIHFEDDNNFIHICKQYTKGKLLPHTKTKDIRDVVIFDDLADVLRKHIECLPKGSKLLFPNEAGNYQNPSNLRNRKWKPLLAYVGITKRVRIHDLRATYINLTLSNGLGIKFAQRQAGHKKSQTTLDVYASCNNDMNKKARGILNEIFSQRNHM